MRYFSLRLGKPDVMGHVIEVDPNARLEDRLKDFIHSFSGEENNLRFKLLSGKETCYAVQIPKRQFNRGAYAPGLAVNTCPGWHKIDEDIAYLLLDKECLQLFRLKTKKGLAVFIDKIDKEQADKIKDEEFNYSMLQLYIAGV